MPYKTKTGKWRAEKTIDGERRTKIFERKEDAKRWETNQSAELWAEESRPIHTVLAAATAYLKFAEETAQPKTFKNKRAQLDRFVTAVGLNASIESITPAQILAVMRALGGERANRFKIEVSAMWEWGVDFLGLPDTNPTKRIKKFPADKKPRRVPTKDEVYRVLEVASPDEYAVILAALHTGARRSELFRLRWSDIDFDSNRITLSTRKREGRGLEHDTIPLTSALASVLMARKKEANSVFVFSRTDGQPLTDWRKATHRPCKKAGVERFGFHALRHLCASMMADASTPLPIIQAILRHTNPNTTARYIRSLRGADALLDDIFKVPHLDPHESRSRPKVVEINSKKS